MPRHGSTPGRIACASRRSRQSMVTSRAFRPPSWPTGTRDLFLSNTIRMHRKLRAAGVEATLQVFEGESHA